MLYALITLLALALVACLVVAWFVREIRADVVPVTAPVVIRPEAINPLSLPRPASQRVPAPSWVHPLGDLTTVNARRAAHAAIDCPWDVAGDGSCCA